MAIPLKACQTMPAARLFAMAAALLALAALQPCLAQSQPSQDQTHPAMAVAPDTGVSLATDGRASNGYDASSQATTLSSGDIGLVENAYDFTDPDRIPGFASTPYYTPALSDNAN